MIPRLLRLLSAHAAELLAPSRCAACGEPLAAPLTDPSPFCAACEDGEGAPAPRLEPVTDELLVAAAASYGGAVAKAIQRLKYGGHPELARPLGRMVARAVEAAIQGDALDRRVLLVPIPLHRARLAERGYNQSALVARSAARALGLECLPLALSRTRRTREQASLDRKERLVNLADAFVASACMRGRRVVLVDDVVTTGATAGAAASAVIRAGGSVALVAAIARTPTG